MIFPTYDNNSNNSLFWVLKSQEVQWTVQFIHKTIHYVEIIIQVGTIRAQCTIVKVSINAQGNVYNRWQRIQP